ncbi:MAG: DUF3039 domain-containing protein [Micrococcus sp.]|nr:DUF3039 domain-containing protein [Micrococcus sp.]
MIVSAEPVTAETETTEPLTGGGGGAAVLEREELAQNVEPGDHERFAHYVRKEKITESAFTGEPVIALCGKVWVPGRDPQKFPVCPTCKEIYDGLRDPQDGGAGQGGSGGGKRGFFGRGRG